MKRRNFALIVAISFLATTFSSCASEVNQNSTVETEPTTEASTATSEVKVTEDIVTSVATTTSESTTSTTTEIVTTPVSTTTTIVTSEIPTTTVQSTTSEIPLTSTTTSATSSDTTSTTLPYTTSATQPTTTSTTIAVATITEAELTAPPMELWVTAPETAPEIPSSTVEIYTEPTIPTESINIDFSNVGFRDLPQELMAIVEKYQRMYPHMEIGVGIYSLDGMSGYEYNVNHLFNGACTIKAAYALFVCTVCDANNIDIKSEQILYTKAHHHGGSGVIQNWGYDKYYSIEELLTYLLNESDNDCMNVLLSRFSLRDFYKFNSSIGGEDDWAAWNAGRATVSQRHNEWLAIYNYVNSGQANSENLRSFLTNTKYAYLMYDMTYWPTYMHKSGWCSPSYTYPSAADAAIIGNRYLMIVMTQDYSEGRGHIDAISELGNAIDDYDYAYGLFK